MEVTNEQFQQFKEFLILKNKSPQSQRSYCSSLRIFNKFIEDRKMKDMNTNTQVRSFLLHKIREGNGWATINTHYSALKIFFENICQQQWNHDLLPRPKKEKKLPKILSTQDVSSLIKTATNLRNFTLLSFLYGTGVRLSEAIAVKIKDIDSNRMQIRINKGKGAKDRMVDLPTSLLKLLREYYLKYRPKEYLFLLLIDKLNQEKYLCL